MPLHIIRNDLINLDVDAIVNPSNPSLNGAGGIDAIIHKKAGPLLDEECQKIGKINYGDAIITKAYDLTNKYIIHVAGPKYIDGLHDEAKLLKSCYLKALNLAKNNNLESIAFPLISTGIYKYPKKEAFEIAKNTIEDFLKEKDIIVYLVVYDMKSLEISKEYYKDIKSFIDDNYIETKKYEYKNILNRRRELESSTYYLEESSLKDSILPKQSLSLEDRLLKLDESFQEMLFRKIDDLKSTDVQIYKNADVDRKLFSKIRNKGYMPNKTTALRLAFALHLTYEETKIFLEKAGHSLTHTNYFDIIIEYCLDNKIYKIYEVNSILNDFDQKSLY